MEMITVKCINNECLNNGVEIEVQLSHVICGVCNAVLNELLLVTDEAAQAAAAAKAAQKAALLERLGITEEEAQLLLGGN